MNSLSLPLPQFRQKFPFGSTDDPQLIAAKHVADGAKPSGTKMAANL